MTSSYLKTAEGLWLWPSDRTTECQVKSGPALAGDLHEGCGVFFLSLRPTATAVLQPHFPERTREREEAGDTWGWWWWWGWSQWKEVLALSKIFIVPLEKQKPQFCPAVERIMNHINTSLFVNQSLFLSLMELVSQTSLWSHSPAAYQLH